MRSSDKKENRFKAPLKAVAALLIFLAAVFGISLLVNYPFEAIYSNSNNRDLVFVGASQAIWQIDPRIIDEDTGLNSYVLGCAGCSMSQRGLLINSAVQQENLKTVVLEISANRMSEFYGGLLGDDIVSMSELSGLSNKVSAAFKRLSFFDDEYDQFYFNLLDSGVKMWQEICLGTYEETAAKKGYAPKDTVEDLTLTRKQAIKKRDYAALTSGFIKSNVKYLKKIFDAMKDSDVRFIVITTPLSEHYIWKYTGWDEFYDAMSYYTEKYGFEYYDFNLLKDRTEYFNDASSFSDRDHLSQEGAETFSHILASIVGTDSIEETGLEFYDSYEEAKEHMTYMKYIE